MTISNPHRSILRAAYVYVFVASFPAFPLAHALDKLPLLPLIESDKFRERFGEEANVSGSVIVGVLAATSEPAVDLADLRIRVPQIDGKSTLCVRTATRDGRYWSLNEHRLTVQGTEARLETRSEHSAPLRKVQPRDFAIRAEIKNGCDSVTRGSLLVASTGSMPESLSKLWVMVNTSTEADFVSGSLRIGSTDFTPALCISNPQSAQVAYNYVCELRVPKGVTGDLCLRIEVAGFTGSKDVYEEIVHFSGASARR